MSFFEEQAALSRGGRIPIHKFGRNEAVGTSFETVWSLGGDYTWPTSTVTLAASSSSANDTAAGDYARKILIYPLDANYNELAPQEITLNGQTKVTTAISALRNARIRVSEAGSNGYAQGHIYVYDDTATVVDGVPSDQTKILSYLDAGTANDKRNRTQQAFFTVPANHRFMMTYIWAFVSVLSTKSANIMLYKRETGRPWEDMGDIPVIGAGNSAVQLYYSPPRNEFPGGTDIEVRARADSEADVSVHFGGYLLAGVN